MSKQPINTQYQIHVLLGTRSLANDQGDWCPFGSNARMFCAAMHRIGYKVVAYGWGGCEDDVECTEYVEVLSRDYFDETFGKMDKQQLYNLNAPEHFHRWNTAAGAKIIERCEAYDIVMNFTGSSQKFATDLLAHEKVLVVEGRIGYAESFAPYRVYESYAKRDNDRGEYAKNLSWFSDLQDRRMIDPEGNESTLVHRPEVMIDHGLHRWYEDTIIEGMINEDTFTPCDPEEVGDYLMFVGRLIPAKGVREAALVAKDVGRKLVVAGHGKLLEALGMEKVPDYVDYIGHIDNRQELVQIMARAYAGVLISHYPEPFGKVHMEFAALDRPVIVSNSGVYSATVLHEITGFRGEGLDDYIFDAKRIDMIKTGVPREWMLNNFSLKSQAPKFATFFDKIRRYEKAGKNPEIRSDNRKEGSYYSRVYPKNI